MRQTVLWEGLNSPGLKETPMLRILTKKNGAVNSQTCS